MISKRVSPISTMERYADIEAEGRRALLYTSGGEISDLPERLADALADMRRQRDAAEATLQNMRETYLRECARANEAEARLADMRQ